MDEHSAAGVLCWAVRCQVVSCCQLRCPTPLHTRLSTLSAHQSWPQSKTCRRHFQKQQQQQHMSVCWVESVQLKRFAVFALPAAVCLTLTGVLLTVPCAPVCRLFAGPAHAQPRGVVEELIADTGFEPTYFGPIRYARNLEVRVLLDGHRKEQGPGAQQPASQPAA